VGGGPCQRIVNHVDDLSQPGLSFPT
jgi:hypothetical protein